MQAVCVGNARETATRAGWMALVLRTDRPAAAALPVGPSSPADLLSARGHQNGGLLSKSAWRSHRRSTRHLGNRRGHERSPCGPSWCAVRAPFIVRDDALHRWGRRRPRWRREEVLESARKVFLKCTRATQHAYESICPPPVVSPRSLRSRSSTPSGRSKRGMQPGPAEHDDCAHDLAMHAFRAL